MPHAIPENLCVAFKDALEIFDLSYVSPLDDVSFGGKDYSIEEICDFVMGYSDPAPEEIYDDICYLITEYKGVERLGYTFDPPKDQSYSSVAACLYKLYTHREHRFYGISFTM